MKAISLWQIWASLIRYNLKEFETRSWGTRYRGKLVIHAAKTREELWNGPDLGYRLLRQAGASIEELPFGAALCVADLVDCIRMTPAFIALQTSQERAFGLWQVGRYAWKLANVRPFPAPIPMSGKQGLFECTLPLDVTEDSASLLRQLPLW